VSAAKIYDSDFVDTETSRYLCDLAVHIAYGYQGSWLAMCEYKRLARDGAVFDPIVARRVLNMALGSADCQPYWASIREGLDRTSSAPPPYMLTTRRSTSPKLTVAREPSRLSGIDVPCTVHATYGRPGSWNGVVHVIDHRQTFMRWNALYLSPGRYDYEHRDPQIQVTWLCGKHTASQRRGGYGGPIEFYKVPPEDHRRCRACMEVESQRNHVGQGI
jgi:hypothetical protein